MDMKKLKDFAGGKDKKGPFPPKMKGYGKKGMHAPIVGKDDKEGHGEEHEDDDHEVEVDVDAVAAEIEAGNGDKQLLKLVKGYDPDKDGNPPSWAVDEDLWEKAKKAVGPEDESDYDNYYAVLASVYEKMGGEIKGGGKGFPPKKKDVEEHDHDDDDEPDDDEDDE